MLRPCNKINNHSQNLHHNIRTRNRPQTRPLQRLHQYPQIMPYSNYLLFADCQLISRKPYQFYNSELPMKKYKTVLGNISSPAIELDSELVELERSSRLSDNEILSRKYQLLQKQVQMLKQSKRTLEKQLEAYRQVVFKGSDIHDILDMQHRKIFELETNLQVLQGKYERILGHNTSTTQTEYAIKCKELENIIKTKEMEHQKEVAGLKAKLMKLSAEEITDRGGLGRVGSGEVGVLRNSRKFV